MNTRSLITAFLAHTEPSVAENTLSNFKRFLERFAKFAKDKPLRTPLLLEYRAQLAREGIKESTIACYMVPLRLFFSWAVEMEHLKENPMPKMRFSFGAPSKVPILAAELEKLIAQAQTIAGYDYWPNAMRVAWHTGLRLSDVALLRKSSLDVQQSSIRALPKKTRKLQRFVEIPVPQDLITALLQDSGAEFVFPAMAESYQKHGHKRLSAQFCHLAGKAGIKKGVHAFRHAFVSRHLNAGVSPALISNMTGINLNQIMTYLYASVDEKREAMGLNQKKESAA